MDQGERYALWALSFFGVCVGWVNLMGDVRIIFGLIVLLLSALLLTTVEIIWRKYDPKDESGSEDEVGYSTQIR